MDHLAAEAVRAAQGVLDAFMKAFNARDIPAFEKTFNFPSVRLASQGLVTLKGARHSGYPRRSGPVLYGKLLAGLLAARLGHLTDRRSVVLAHS